MRPDKTIERLLQTSGGRNELFDGEGILHKGERDIRTLKYFRASFSVPTFAQLILNSPNLGSRHTLTHISSGVQAQDVWAAHCAPLGVKAVSLSDTFCATKLLFRCSKTHLQRKIKTKFVHSPYIEFHCRPVSVHIEGGLNNLICLPEIRREPPIV